MLVSRESWVRIPGVEAAWMGHFRVAICLGFEVSLGAQLLEGKMSLICIRIRNSFPFEWLCARTRFETETCSNSEMGYCSGVWKKQLLKVLITSTHFSTLFILRYRPKYIVLFLEPLDWNFTFLLPLKDRKKWSYFDPKPSNEGEWVPHFLTSQIKLHRCFNEKQSVTSTWYWTHTY